MVTMMLDVDPIDFHSVLHGLWRYIPDVSRSYSHTWFVLCVDNSEIDGVEVHVLKSPADTEDEL